MENPLIHIWWCQPNIYSYHKGHNIPQLVSDPLKPDVCNLGTGSQIFNNCSNP